MKFSLPELITAILITAAVVGLIFFFIGRWYEGYNNQEGITDTAKVIEFKEGNFKTGSSAGEEKIDPYTTSIQQKRKETDDPTNY